MFDRSQNSQLIQISCTSSKPDSLKGTFQAIGKLPTDADDVYVRHYGNGLLLLELTFQQVDSSLQKLFLAKEIEHESLLAESFKEWFITNATGELGSFKMPNLGEERIYFLGINEVSAEKWLSDSTAQLVKAFPLGARFILDKTVQNESPVFGIVKNGVLFFSYNSELLKGLNDYLNVSSNMASLDQFKNFPKGGELILRPNFESNQLKAMGVNQAWFHGTYDEGYVKWIQLLGSEKSVQPEPVVDDSSIEENTSSELIFTVDNHLTSEKNEVHCSGNKLRWIENGNVRFEFECKSEIRDVKQIDQRGNGKLQVLILTHGGLDLCDVNGTRLSGFPVAVEQGTNGVWLVTNHKNPESCRILVASNVNKILNLRVNGQSSSGWQSPIFSSEIELIEESKEGYAVLCSNGEKSQLKKTGIRIK
jgi:hypothetical protein